SDMRMANGERLSADGRYKVAGWAAVSEESRDAAKRDGAPPVWQLVEQWLAAHRRVHVSPVRQPRLIGVESNAGLASGKPS
ncbi:MAG TPA: thiosulfohydrolase SoxB, partial [Burkholderiaceae bacterium]